MAALNFPTTPTDGQVYNNYRWNATDGVWRLIPIAGDLDSLDDVSTAAASSGDSLVYDGTEWAPTALGLDDISNVSASAPVSGDSLVYNGTNWVNGPRSGNVVINGDFGVWQRGTSFSQLTSAAAYTADRFMSSMSGTSPNYTTSRQAFTPADIQAVGYGDAEFFYRQTVNSATSATRLDIDQRIEDVRTLAGQTVTLSFWAKGVAGTNLQTFAVQYFGSGGSPELATNNPSLGAPNTSWVRYSQTFTLPSVAGKTIGSNSYLRIIIRLNNPVTGNVLDVWGVQLEAGNTATPFKLAGGGSKAAELALCQRYYTRFAGGSIYSNIAAGHAASTTSIPVTWNLPTSMRAEPTAVDFANIMFSDFAAAPFVPSALVIDTNNSGPDVVALVGTVSGATQFRRYVLCNNNNASGYVGVSAEI